MSQTSAEKNRFPLTSLFFQEKMSVYPKKQTNSIIAFCFVVVNADLTTCHKGLPETPFLPDFRPCRVKYKYFVTFFSAVTLLFPVYFFTPAASFWILCNAVFIYAIETSLWVTRRTVYFPKGTPSTPSSFNTAKNC